MQSNSIILVNYIRIFVTNLTRHENNRNNKLNIFEVEIGMSKHNEGHSFKVKNFGIFEEIIRNYIGTNREVRSRKKQTTTSI